MAIRDTQRESFFHRTRWVSLVAFIILAGLWFQLSMVSMVSMTKGTFLENIVPAWLENSTKSVIYCLRYDWKLQNTEYDWVMPSLSVLLITLGAVAGAATVYFRKSTLTPVIYLAVLSAWIVTAWLAPTLSHQMGRRQNSALVHRTSLIHTLIHSQLKSYRVSHKNTYPPLNHFWDCMIKQTDENGNVTSNGKYGPYLKKPPNNPSRTGTKITADTSGSWCYNETTGEFRAVISQAQAIKIGLGDWNDQGNFTLSRASRVFVVDSTNNYVAQLSPGQIFRYNAWKKIKQWMGKPIAYALPHPLLALCLIVGFQWYARRRHCSYRTIKLFCSIWIIALSTLIAAIVWAVMSNTYSQTPELASAIAINILLAAWPAIIILQFTHHRLTRAQRGLCIACGYDLRGCVQAEDVTCPECGQRNPNSPLAAKA